MATATTLARPQCVGAADADDRRQSFTIADLSREFDVTARTIRFYEDQGLIAPTRLGLNRVYSRADRFRLGWILRGKRLGFSLAEIKELLALYETDRSRVSQLKAALKRARERVADMERRAADLQAQIDELRELEKGAVDMLRQRGADPDKD
jgi:DNA-binding transcriptional MerR regulator